MSLLSQDRRLADLGGRIAASPSQDSQLGLREEDVAKSIRQRNLIVMAQKIDPASIRITDLVGDGRCLSFSLARDLGWRRGIRSKVSMS